MQMGEALVAKLTKDRAYHHGDLRAALLIAAEAELAERGIEGFTLRSCARRAGVSHAAPAHHFGDVTGLLTVLATEAFQRLSSSMESEIALVPRGTHEHLIGVAMGYVAFAVANPNLFKLMFRTERLHMQDETMMAAGREAFSYAADAVGEFYGSADPMADPELSRRVLALWSFAHGFSGLLLASQFGPVETAGSHAAALVPDTVNEMFNAQTFAARLSQVRSNTSGL